MSFTHTLGNKQVHNPSATTAGLNVGSLAGSPSALENGDVWYDANQNKFQGRAGGTTVTLAESRLAEEVANREIAINPLVLRLACLATNISTNAVEPLTLTLGRVVQFSGSLYKSDSTGNNTSYVQIPAVAIPDFTRIIQKLGIAEVASIAGTVPATALRNVLPAFSDSGLSSAMTMMAVDPRGATHRHVGLGIVADTHGTIPLADGGGLNFQARWPSPSWLRGGSRYDGGNEDVVVLWPGDLSAPKLAVLCHGSGVEAEAFINSPLSAAPQSCFQMGHEPIVRLLLSRGYICVMVRGGPTTTSWGSQVAYNGLTSAIARVRALVNVGGEGFILGTSMGGLAGLRLLKDDPYFTRFYGFDPVCSLADCYGATVTTGNTNLRRVSFAAAINTAHGISAIGDIPAACSPVTYAAGVWAGKKMRATVIGGASTDLALGCDGVVSRLGNWDALATIASSGGATVWTDVGTNTASAGSDHGRMGNLLLANVTALLDA